MTDKKSLSDWLAYIQTVHFRSVDMGLDRVQVVMSQLLPRLRYKVIAVGGTNGKGSCATMADSILNRAGYRTGLYTSPHLVRYNERVRIDGLSVEDELLCRAFQTVEDARGPTPLTYFEFGTLAAAWIFDRADVDVGIMEVGMGGRLDAVNALSLDACLITNVDIDHTHWLGNGVEQIAWEKAHIMRSGHLAVYGSTALPQALSDHALAIGARLVIAGRDYGWQSGENRWTWYGPKGQEWTLPVPPLDGEVQYDNAAAVLALLTEMDGLSVSPDHVSEAMREVRLGARLQRIKPGVGEPEVIVDVAHNASAVRVLKANLSQGQEPGVRTLAVFGMLRDKDLKIVADIMNDTVDLWFLATIEDERGQTARELGLEFERWVSKPLSFHDSAVEAFRQALSEAAPRDRVLVFGSFHIAGDILRHLDVIP